MIFMVSSLILSITVNFNRLLLRFVELWLFPLIIYRTSLYYQNGPSTSD